VDAPPGAALIPKPPARRSLPEILRAGFWRAD